MKTKRLKQVCAMFLLAVLVAGILPVFAPEAAAWRDSTGYNWGCTLSSATSGCRTHHWCSYGHSQHEYDTYNHTYRYGSCTKCGASNGHVHSYSSSVGSAHPHYITMTCSCGYSYSNGNTRYYSWCTSCNACANGHNYVVNSYTALGNGQHTVKKSCSRCGSPWNGTTSCSKSGAVTYTTNSNYSHTAISQCSVCHQTFSDTAACSLVKDGIVGHDNYSHTVYSHCTVCGGKFEGKPATPCTLEAERTYNGNGTHTTTSKCVYCGMAHKEVYPCEPAWEYETLGDGMHIKSGTCPHCGGNQTGTAEKCTPDAEGFCTVCGGSVEDNLVSECSIAASISSIAADGSVLEDSISDSGVLSIEKQKGGKIDATLTVTADVAGDDKIASFTLLFPCADSSNQSSKTTTGSTISYNISTSDMVGAYIATLITEGGSECQIYISVKEQMTGITDIRYRTVGMHVRRFDGGGPRFSSATNGNYVDLIDASVLDQAGQDRVYEMAYRADADWTLTQRGETVSFSGSMVVEVVNTKTDKLIGIYDTLDDYDALTTDIEWGNATVADFQDAQSKTLSMQFPVGIDAEAHFILQHKTDKEGVYSNEEIGSLHAMHRYDNDINAYVVYPSQRKTMEFNMYLAGRIPENYEYHGVEWHNSPTKGSGSEVGRTSISDTFTYRSGRADYYFYWRETDAEEQTGIINVKVYDGKTFKELPDACVEVSDLGIGRYFEDVPLGTYTATASAEGYNSGSATATISKTQLDANIVIYLMPNGATETLGDLSVLVIDSRTNAIISSANVTVSGLGSGTSFSDVPLGTYTATASASGYGSGSGSATLTELNPSGVITIRLTPYGGGTPTPTPTPTPDPTPAPAPVERLDLTVVSITPAKYVPTEDVISTVTVKGSGKDYIPGDHVKVKLEIPHTGFSETVDGVVMKDGTTNIVAFRWHTPTVSRETTIALTATIDPDNTIAETNENNNTLTKNVTLSPITYPSLTEREKVYPTVPALDTSTPTRTWTEQRYEGGEIVEKSYWAKLTVAATTDYRTKSSGYLRSGYGFEISVTATITTNYDKSDLVVGAQRTNVFLPQYGYANAINLVPERAGDVTTWRCTYHFSSNPDSVYNNPNRYVPVWWKDEYRYIIQAVVADAYTPAGSLYQWVGGNGRAGDELTIKIEGSMYDDDIAVPHK